MASTLVIASHITSSGNISSSGNFSLTGNASIGDFTTGNHSIKGTQIFIGSADTSGEAQTSLLEVGGSTETSIKLFSTHTGTNRDVGIHMSASANGQEYSIGLNRVANTFYISPSPATIGPESSVFEIDASGNITSSGNISSSNDIIAQQLLLREGSTGGIIFNDDGAQTSDGFIGLINKGINIFADNSNPTAASHLFVSQSGGTGMAHGKVGINTITPNEHLEVVGNISASGNIIASSISAGTLTLDQSITSAAAADSAVYTVNGARCEIRNQLQGSVAADTGWTVELRNTSIAANSLIVANIINGPGANGGIVSGSVVTANVIAANTASLNFFNTGIAIPDDAEFTASIAIF